MPFNLNSQSIKVFPLAKPRSVASKDITSRIFYEQNVSNLVRQLLDVEGFVVSGNVDTNGEVVENLAIDLMGYYFEIESGTILTDNISDDANELYAAIKFKSNDNDSDENYPIEIDGQDTNGVYMGITFFEDVPTQDWHKLKLLEKDSTGWKLVDGSNAKFSAKSIKIDWIDGQRK